MLAKDIKIKNLYPQRSFIKKQLDSISEQQQKDGNSIYTYVGYIFPENINYFESEGFRVKPVKSDMLMAMTRGIPVYLFTVADNIQLSEEELKQAENYHSETADMDDRTDLLDTIMRDLFSRDLGKF